MQSVFNQDYKHLSLEQRERALIVELTTGHKANALCFETLAELTDLANALEDSHDVAAVILRGQGAVFTGGINLADPRLLQPAKYSLRDRRRMASLGSKMCQAWENIQAITVAAIEGPCVGAGVALSLALDFRVCAAGSMLYVPEIERGMNMSWQSVPRSVALIGPAKTKRMFALAEKISAELANNWGWSDYSVAQGQAVEKAMDIASQAAKMPSVPMRMCKQSINIAANALGHALSYMDSDQLLLAQQGEDFEESINAFLEKRDPDYNR